MQGQLSWHTSRMLDSPGVRLFAVSLLLLFAEVMCIRWLAVELPLMRVFPNLVLTVIFVSASIGLATFAKAAPRTLVLLFSIVSTWLLLVSADYTKVQNLSLREPVTALLCLTLIGFIVLNLTLIFVALGRVLGQLFGALPPLKAYAVNLAGSIAGVAIFAAVSWLKLPPAVWLLVTGGLTWFICRKYYVPALALAMVIGTAFAYRESAWSPYGKIQLVTVASSQAEQGNYTLVLNGDFFQTASKILPGKTFAEIVEKYKDFRQTERDYRCWLEIPYMMASSWDKVLVLGAGGGNDVSCALLHDARHVEAVERDPFIASLGFTRHPDRPYSDPRVTVKLTDARTFLRNSRDKYDLIQFAFLDPGRTYRVSSFLRSDNFVYTREAIRSAIDHLSDRGIVSVSFATGGDSPVTRRLYKTITDASGSEPFAMVQDRTGSCFFLFGPGLTPLKEKELALADIRIWPRRGEYFDTRPAVDDWPFLYLEFTESAFVFYIFVLAAAAAMPLAVMRTGLSAKAPFHEWGPSFFLGMAFMLVETKAITQLALLYGATWIVASVTIFVILVLAFIANWVVDRLKLANTAPFYAGIVMTLLIDYFWRVPAASAIPPVVLSGLGAFVCCLPVFFGGMVFSTLLGRSSSSVAVLAANILGVAAGALMENLCVVSGIKSLSLIAIGLYLGSALPLALGRPAVLPVKAVDKPRA